MREANRTLVRAGFLLFTLALLTGLAIPGFLNPKMALGAHITGILSGLMLIVLGLSWGMLSLKAGQERLTSGTFLYANFANWIGSCLAAAWGTSLLTPISAAGHSAEPWKEGLVAVIQLSVALTALTGDVLVIYGLRPTPKPSQ